MSLLKVSLQEDDFDFAMTCYQHDNAPALLSMDDFQQLRWSLQQLRGKLAPEQKLRLDDMFRECLMSYGERLFLIDEEPVDAAEFSRLHADRDRRYNAASYFVELWDREDKDLPGVALSSDGKRRLLPPEWHRPAGLDAP